MHTIKTLLADAAGLESGTASGKASQRSRSAAYPSWFNGALAFCKAHSLNFTEAANSIGAAKQQKIDQHPLGLGSPPSGREPPSEG